MLHYHLEKPAGCGPANGRGRRHYSRFESKLCWTAARLKATRSAKFRFKQCMDMLRAVGVRYLGKPFMALQGKIALIRKPPPVCTPCVVTEVSNVMQTP